jgi:hypothetical protein
MCALHQKNLDSPYARFGSEVAMRFLSPTSPAARSSLSRFADYLSQEWYRPLVEWSDMRWEGDLVFLSNGNECYQQVGIRPGPRQPWKSVRWILSLVPGGAGPEWRISSVLVQEPEAVQVCHPPPTAPAGARVGPKACTAWRTGIAPGMRVRGARAVAPAEPRCRFALMTCRCGRCHRGMTRPQRSGRSGESSSPQQRRTRRLRWWTR